MSINHGNEELGRIARRLIEEHIKHKEMCPAEYILSVLVNEYFKQEIRKFRGE